LHAVVAVPLLRVPVGSVPRKLPSMRVPTESLDMSMAEPKKPFTTRPLITLPEAFSIRSPSPPALVPSRTTFMVCEAFAIL
jgi:hypothetical protein